MNKQDIDISLVNPFLGAAFDVFKQIFGCELKKGQISVKKNPSASFEVAIIIGISGNYHTGVVVYSIKEYSANKMIQSMDPDIDIKENKEAFFDAIGELANIISGNAMANFSKQGVDLNITTPSVISGDAFNINLLDQTTLSTTMTSPFGEMEINVAIKKT